MDGRLPRQQPTPVLPAGRCTDFRDHVPALGALGGRHLHQPDHPQARRLHHPSIRSLHLRNRHRRSDHRPAAADLRRRHAGRHRQAWPGPRLRPQPHPPLRGHQRAHVSRDRCALALHRHRRRHLARQRRPAKPQRHPRCHRPRPRHLHDLPRARQQRPRPALLFIARHLHRRRRPARVYMGDSRSFRLPHPRWLNRAERARRGRSHRSHRGKFLQWRHLARRRCALRWPLHLHVD